MGQKGSQERKKSGGSAPGTPTHSPAGSGSSNALKSPRPGAGLLGTPQGVARGGAARAAAAAAAAREAEDVAAGLDTSVEVSSPKRSHMRKHSSLNGDELSEDGRRLLVQPLSTPLLHGGIAAIAHQSSSGSVFYAPDDAATAAADLQRAEARDASLALRLRAVVARPDNSTCADCTSTSSTWASTTFGVVLCLECCGAHRSLGSDVSFTQSTTIDAASWSEEAVARLERTSNVAVNEELEYHVPSAWPKPDRNAPDKYRWDYVRAKYAQRRFARGGESGAAGSLPPLKPVPWGERKTMLGRTRSTRDSAGARGKVAFVGIVQVTCVYAEQLATVHGAIPVMGSPAFYTNPYCVVKLGSYRGRTKAAHRTAAPQWNEGPQQNVSLNMSWDGRSLLKVSVWSRDRLKHKDKMLGSALVDIRDLANKPDDAEVQGREPAPDAHQVWVRIFQYRPSVAAAAPTAAEGDAAASAGAAPAGAAAPAEPAGAGPGAAERALPPKAPGAAASTLSRDAASGASSDGNETDLALFQDVEDFGAHVDGEEGDSDDERQSIPSSSSDEEDEPDATMHGGRGGGRDPLPGPPPLPAAELHDETRRTASHSASSDSAPPDSAAPSAELSASGKEQPTHYRKASGSMGSFHFRERVKGALESSKTAMETLKHDTKQGFDAFKHVMLSLRNSSSSFVIDETDELGAERRKLGYVFAGKVLLELRFQDLR
jgi:stromal membrane-associated protein